MKIFIPDLSVPENCRPYIEILNNPENEFRYTVLRKKVVEEMTLKAIAQSTLRYTAAKGYHSNYTRQGISSILQKATETLKRKVTLIKTVAFIKANGGTNLSIIMKETNISLSAMESVLEVLETNRKIIIQANGRYYINGAIDPEKVNYYLIAAASFELSK